MRILVAAAALAAAATAAADPITAKLGKRKVTLTPCTVDGPALYLGNVMSGLVATPDGALLVLDRDGGVHRYLVAKGADCRLTADPKFGKDGVIASGIPAKQESEWTSVMMDRGGTIYVDGYKGTVRIRGGKAEPMCLEGLLAASPRSDHVWRWKSLDRVIRTDADCKDLDVIDLTPHGEHQSGAITALDDRILADTVDDEALFDAHGKRLHVLAGSDRGTTFAFAWDLCGKGVCAAGEYAFYAWGADGKPLGHFDTQTLSQTDRSWTPHGFATAGATGWLVGDEYMDTAPAHPAIVLRADGLP